MESVFYKNLNRQLKKSDITLECLCEIINISSDSLRQVLEKGLIPDSYTTEKIADFFKLSPSYFYSEYKECKTHTVSIPIVAQIPCDTSEKKQNGTKTVELSAYINEFGSYTAYVIKDYSMEPQICIGDIVIISNQNYAASGEIVLCEIGGKALELRKVKQLSEGYVFYSFNQENKPVFISRENFENCSIIKIIGRVASVIKKGEQDERKP